MSDIEDSEEYLTIGQIPIISEQANIKEVVSQISEHNKGGFLVKSATQGSNYKTFVFAKPIAQAALELVRNEGVISLKTKVLAEVLKSLGRKATIDIEEKSLPSSTNASALQALKRSVFRVAKDDETVGLLFNMDAALAIVQTSPPKYICEDGHYNPWLGDGYCDRCSKPIRVE